MKGKEVKVGDWIGDRNGRSGIVKEIEDNMVIVATDWGVDLTIMASEIAMVVEGGGNGSD